MRRAVRGQLGSMAVVAALVALSAGVVLASLAGARRTLSVVDRLEAAAHAADVEVQLSGDVDALAEVAALDHLVTEVAGYSVLFFAPQDVGAVPGLDFFVAVAAPGATGAVDEPIVVDGRLPAPGAPDEVTVNEAARDRFDLDVGERVTLASFSVEQLEDATDGGAVPDALEGPAVGVTITGVAHSRAEALIPEQFGPGMWASEAFGARFAEDELPQFGPVVLARLADGASPGALSAALADLPGLEEPPTVTSSADTSDQARDASRLQAGGLVVVAVVVLVGGAVVVGQAVQRQLRAAGPDRLALRSIGLTRAQLRATVAGPCVLATVTGMGVAVAGAAAASGLFPARSQRRIEPDPGLALDPLVLAGGGVLLAVLVVAAVWWRAGRLTTEPAVRPRPSLVSRLARLGPPELGVGLRLAFERSPTASPAVSGLGLVGSLLAIGGVVAAATFAASLDDLRASPSRYGWNWDTEAASGGDPDELEPVIEQLGDDPRVADLTTARVVGTATVEDRDVQAYAFEAQRGEPIFLTLLDGRPPSADDEVVLGPLTAERADAGLGGVVEAVGRRGPVQLRVVGIGLFPVLESEAYRNGAALTPGGLDRLRTTGGYQSVLVNWADGVDVDAAFAELQADGLGFEAGVPPALDNLDEVTAFPVAVGAAVSALGVVATLHAVAAGVRRRQPDLAVLHALGFRRRQVARAVLVHACALTGTGVGLGLVLGIVAGRTSWHAMARSLDVAPDPVVPVAVLLAAVGVAVVVAAGSAAMSVARLRWWRPATALRVG